ncbi:Alpha/Beta hydrolase protein [Jimgerdemannia flammicorona]|uniref:Alpha/Beta hydrolase protein n=1 Tax=Jimgerdemannia flammicorona TaxID=994334 RepID=A0A433QU78_9FUNG|nr:Alpha/Beta hydrolase protein [Jimgerdemannia flammicorona]
MLTLQPTIDHARPTSVPSDRWSTCAIEGCCKPLPTPAPITTVALVQRNTATELLLKSVSLLTHNVRSLATDFLTHTFSKPKKPSWDIRLAMFVSVFQQITSHTHLGDLAMARALVFMPNMIPWSAVITETSFRVSSHKLKGLLAVHDAQEDGSRELTGEWVAERKVWERWNAETKARASDAAERSALDLGGRIKGKRQGREKVVLYLHGGAYYLMSAKTHRDITYRVSKVTGQRVFALNYRLSPETPFPGALLDAVYAFLYLTDPDGLAINPKDVVVMGDSAGGGLALALLFYLRDHDMETPGGGVLFSPWVDLTFSSPSWDTNILFDYLPPRPQEDAPLHPTRFYLGDQYPQLAKHPYVSPLFATSFENLPPLLIQHGDSENLCDEINQLARRLAESETTHVQHECYEDMVHVFHAFNFLEPAKKAMESVGGFVKNVVPTVHKYQAQVSKLLKQSHPASATAPVTDGLTLHPVDPAAQLRTSKSDPNLHRHFGGHLQRDTRGVARGLDISPWTMTAADGIERQVGGVRLVKVPLHTPFTLLVRSCTSSSEKLKASETWVRL